MKYPKNCKKCGGKMQRGGLMYAQQQQLDLQKDLQALKPQDAEGQFSMLPMQTEEPLYGNRIEEGAMRGIVDQPKGYNSAQEWYNFVDSSAEEKRHPSTPKNWMRNLGTGLMGLRTLGSEISGRVARARQNQYDYLQQTALGMMNSMPATDYQPNPYSLYAKYGGSLKKYQQGGTNPPIYTRNPNDPRLRAYSDSLRLYNQGMQDRRDLEKEVGPTRELLYDDNLDYSISEDYKDPSSELYNSWKKTGILPDREYIGNFDNKLKLATRYSYGYKKPVQPVIYRRQNMSGRPSTVFPDISNDVSYTPSAPNVMGPTGIVDNETPTNYSFTFPMEGYNQQKSIYFPDIDSWRKALKSFNNVSSKEAGDGSSASATGNLKYGGLSHVNYFGPPFSNGATYKFSDSEKYDKTIVSRKLVPQLFLRQYINKKRYNKGGSYRKLKK